MRHSILQTGSAFGCIRRHAIRRERDDGRRNAGDLCRRGRIARVDELSSVAALIAEAATGTRRLTPDELRRVLEHVAQAGFDPTPHARAGGRLTGVQWQGRILRGSDWLTSAEAHYLRHVTANNEWPTGTTMDDYISSIRRVILDRHSGVILSHYQGAPQLTVVRESGVLRGPSGAPWVLVDYRIGLSYWMTAFQPPAGLSVLRSSDRENIQWLRRPRRQTESSEV